MSDDRYHQEHPRDWPIGSAVYLIGPEVDFLRAKVGWPVRATVIDSGPEFHIFRNCVAVSVDGMEGTEVQWEMVDVIKASDLPAELTPDSIEAWLSE